MTSRKPPLRAPAPPFGVLAEPALDQLGTVLADNRRLLEQAPGALLGRAWPELRQQARRAVLAAAVDYLRRAGEPVPEFGSESLILAGHQPELFHPGVWVKNFALHGLARAHNLTPVNLVVDNDTNKSNLLKLPAGLAMPPAHLESLPYDHWASEVPYEERTVRDEALFASLAERAARFFRDWTYEPMLPAFWEEVVRQGRRTSLLGERFAAARRTWERRWGCHNLEIPVSAVCRTEPFAWFAAHLLSELPRFHAIYNAVVHDYRKQYDIHSRNHPVPDLTQQDDWLETPFWAWRTGQQRRGRLLARLRGQHIELRSGEDTWPALPLPARDPGQTVAALQALEQRGLKIRSRALTNTLFARLFLGDLFIHGIGGGKYDELTDEISRRFYELEPPRFLVLSATLLLPLARPQISAEDVKQAERDLRDLHYNPQRHLGAAAGAEAAVLARRKLALIEQAPLTRQERAKRFHDLRKLNEQLVPFVRDEEGQTRARLERWSAAVRLREVLGRRDFAFCLHPEADLRAFCTELLVRARATRDTIRQEG